MNAKIYRFSDWVPVTEPAQLKKIFENMLATSGHTILNFVEHHFEPQGYTALWLLGESHLAIHTFPEHGRSYVELSSCMFPLYRRFVNEFAAIAEE